ncbi:MAG: hypothetical protein ACXAEU_09865 [Candidatus Hodarchaeales archaeon]|jgi:hypothetical protein
MVMDLPATHVDPMPYPTSTAIIKSENCGRKFTKMGIGASTQVNIGIIRAINV